MEDENRVNLENSDNSNVSASRKRNRSPSSSSDSASSRDSSPVRRPKRPRRDSVSDLKFQVLSQQMAFLTNLITQNQNEPKASTPQAIPAVNEPAAIDRSIGNVLGLRPPQSVSESNNQLKLFDLSTTLKDPPFPKSNEAHLSELTQLQRFKCDDWNAIRFSEAQKKYASTPGFVELSINDELRRFNASGVNDDRLHLLERTYAALTNAIITQKDELRITLQTLVDWSNNSETTLTPRSLFDKIEQIFGKDSNYTKVTDDILQICCGRRADFIHSRRESILKQIPEEYHCGVLRKIPPDAVNIFDGGLLATYLQKIGGAEKLMGSMQAQQNIRTSTNNQRRDYDGTSKPVTSSQTTDNSFRRNLSTSKDKFKGHGKSSTNNNSKNKHYSKGKKSNSPNKNNRA